MPRRKFESDEERMNAVREYRKKYYTDHRDVIVNRSRRWRADNKPARNPPPVENQPEPQI